MSEFATIADLFPDDKQPTRELEPIQKVDRTEQIERDIEEFIETESAKRVLSETARIVGTEGMNARFRYVHATFGSGKSHLLKLIGVATGEIEGLEDHAHELANTKSGFKEFRDSIADSGIDHLLPLFMNLLDRDHEDTKLPIMIFDELGRRRGYPTSRPWLLEFCWRLDIEHGIWDALRTVEYEGLRLDDVVERPSSLRPWLMEAVPQLEGASAAGFETEEAVESEIENAASAIDEDAFGPLDLVDRLDRTKRTLEENSGEIYQFLIGLDEIAIYVGDQPRRYREVVNTIEALIENLRPTPPILGTGQWSLRDMQQNFVGEVNDDEWYAQEIELRGADTETIARKRWLQKSTEGRDYIESELLPKDGALEPQLAEDHDSSGPTDPIEAYPFRDRDLELFRAVMQGLIKGDRETDREYIQGRALLVRVRSLFADHGWADREPGAVVPWDDLFDILREETVLIPSWAVDLINRVGNTLEGPLATRTAKALFLLSQVDFVPRTADNLARLLASNVDQDVDSLKDEVAATLEKLSDRNLIKADTDADQTTYTILSERDIRFWDEVAQEAAGIPEHQLRDNVLQLLLEAADPDRLTTPDSTATRTFASVQDVKYTVRYSINQGLPESVTDRHDAIVIRLLIDEADSLLDERDRWQDQHGGPGGREDVLVTVELPQASREQVRRLVGMRSVLSGMADPRPEYEIERQNLQRDLEDDLQDRLYNGSVYSPTRGTAFGAYLESLDEAVVDAVDAKFPNRKHIERPLQLDDLARIDEFLEDTGSWPLAEQDAEVIGVNPLTGDFEVGWREEFLAEFDGDDWVSGEQVLETIEGRRGAFLGTSEEALQALLFVLVANNDIEVRRDGERVTDLDDIARILANRTQLADAVIGFDPDPRPEGLDELYELVLGDASDTDDTRMLVEDIAEWAQRNGSTIRTVVSQVSLVFESRHAIEEFEAALEPAFSGEELSAKRLATPAVIDQARRYRKVKPVFIADDPSEESLWSRFEAAYKGLADRYPASRLVEELEPYHLGTLVPGADKVEEKLDAIEEYRINQLQSLYGHLTGESTDSDDIDALCANITEALRDGSLESDIDRVEEAFEAVSLDRLRSLASQAAETDETLPESAIAEEAVRSEAERLGRGRELLEQEVEGSPVFDQLVELEAALSDTHEGFITTHVLRAVKGPDLPTVDRAMQLLEQGQRQIEGLEPTDGDDQILEEVWSEIAGHDEGTIVVFDPEANR